MTVGRDCPLWTVRGTDGAQEVEKRCQTTGYTYPDGKRPDALAELAAAGLWELDDDGCHVPNFLRYQTPAAQIERARATDRERKRRERQPVATPDLSVSGGMSDRTAGRSHGGVTEDRTGSSRGNQLRNCGRADREAR